MYARPPLDLPSPILLPHPFPLHLRPLPARRPWRIVPFFSSTLRGRAARDARARPLHRAQGARGRLGGRLGAAPRARGELQGPLRPPPAARTP